MHWILTFFTAVILSFSIYHCATMPPTAKLIDQVTKNDSVVEELDESDLPEPVKARAVSAIQTTQNLAVDASKAFEGCKANLASADAAKWKFMALGVVLGAVAAFFVTRGVYKA